MKVFTSRSAWTGFLRRAKDNHPREHIEALWGHEAVDAFRVVKFNRIRLKKDQDGKLIQTSDGLDYTNAEVARQKKLAKEAGLKFLGTIHTHPSDDDEPAPSFADHKSGVRDGERIMGVVHLFKPKQKNSRFKHLVTWWFPQQQVPFEILPE